MHVEERLRRQERMVALPLGAESPSSEWDSVLIKSRRQVWWQRNSKPQSFLQKRVEKTEENTNPYCGPRSLPKR